MFQGIVVTVVCVSAAAYLVFSICRKLINKNGHCGSCSCCRDNNESEQREGGA
ncbi:hypothetical protein ACFL1X_03050 [Candidatus Hydrogenedentota bacterium]